jgi:hypothetical protein
MSGCGRREYMDELCLIIFKVRKIQMLIRELWLHKDAERLLSVRRRMIDISPSDNEEIKEERAKGQ